MKYLLKNALIVAPSSLNNNKKVDLLIENGIISKIASSIKDSKATELTSKELIVSPGWFDMRCSIPDPGHEYKETIESGLNAAAAGGFTAIATMPTSLPIRDSKSEILYAIEQAQNHCVDLHPIGAISEKLEGKNLAELYDMHTSGAVAFSEGTKSIQDDNLMLRALLYTKGFDGLVINQPNSKSISQNGKMHEGETSTLLGLKGIPALAEELMISRDLFLLNYTSGKLHIGPVSSKESVSLIKNGKKLNQNVSAETSIMNLVYDDTALKEFESNFKVFPPLRTKKDISTLIKGLNDGVIDVISSNHIPENIENKDVELDRAEFGSTNLETFYPLYNQFLASKISLETWVNAVSNNPRKILGLNKIDIKVGEPANLTIFDPTIDWDYDSKTKKSLSSNNPKFESALKGKVLGVINGKKAVLN